MTVVDSIEALVARVDAVLLESVDGRPHLQQVRPVFAARKRVFIDKSLTGSLRDVNIADSRWGLVFVDAGRPVPSHTL